MIPMRNRRRGLVCRGVHQLRKIPQNKRDMVKMKMDDKIYKLGLRALDELLLHRNSSKETIISIEDASILSDMIVHVGPHAIFTFDEAEIINFYHVWSHHKKERSHE